MRRRRCTRSTSQLVRCDHTFIHSIPLHLPTRSHTIARYIHQGVSAFVVVVGATALLGWLLGIPRLADWLGLDVAMFPNTAIAMVLTGTALWWRAGPWVRGARVLAVLGGVLGLATLSEHLLHVDLGIDHLLVRGDWGHRGAFVRGRIGLPASVMFVVINAAIFVSTLTDRWNRAVVGGALLCIGIALISILGYMFGTSALYILPEISGIAINTSVCFTLLGCGLIASMPGKEPMRTLLEPSATGALVRRALPFMVLVPIGIGLLRWAGEEALLFNTGFGMALHTLTQVVVLLVLLWWMAKAVRQHEQVRTQSEQAVRRSEQRYQAFVQNSSEGIWRCEMDEPMPLTLTGQGALDWVYRHGYLAECNNAMARMYGYSLGTELVGARLGDMLPRTPKNEAFLLAFMADGFQLLGGHSEEQDKEGNTLHFANNLVGIVEDSMLVRAWGSQVDITAQTLAQRALLESDRRKDEFLATLAHELRNPLAPLSNGLELLSATEEPMTAEEEAEVIRMMQRQLKHMVRLVDDLLDITRINKGKVVLQRERIAFGPVFHMAVESATPHMQRAGHHLETELPDEPLYVHADPVRLVQICGNLLTNAAKFTPAGGHIRFRAARSDDQLVLAVQDNGKGIAPEHLEQVFDMFIQLDPSPHREHHGLGIGLALVKRLVEKHGGRITAHSDGLGKGTTMRVELPLATEAADPGSPA